MFNKHFFKFTLGFIGMILLGLVGLLLVQLFGFSGTDNVANISSTEITK